MLCARRPGERARFGVGLWARLGLALALACGCRADDPSPASVAAERDGPAVERTTIGAIAWYVDYDAAVAVAREQDKALWVHFGENPG